GALEPCQALIAAWEPALSEGPRRRFQSSKTAWLPTAVKSVLGGPRSRVRVFSSSVDRSVPSVIYGARMPDRADVRRLGAVFNEVAGDYDRHRPGYPDVLIDRAFELAGLGPGVPVLEIGSG